MKLTHWEYLREHYTDIELRNFAISFLKSYWRGQQHARIDKVSNLKPQSQANLRLAFTDYHIMGYLVEWDKKYTND